jgi:hypothetical protein
MIHANQKELFPFAAELSPAEQVIYQMIYEAAEIGDVCPINIDLEMAAGFNSCSMGSAVVKRLESKGLIKVDRFQKFREVEIVATGKRTARSVSMHVTRPHVAKGCGAGSRSLKPTVRKGYKRGRV